MRSNLPNFAIIVATTLVFAACRPQNGTTNNLQSLDNFAAAETVSQNSCEGSVTAAPGSELARYWEERIIIGTDIKGKLSIDSQKRYKDAVRKYLSAVPAAAQQAFFDFGGQILLSSNSQEICSRQFGDKKSSQYLPDARKSIESCFTYASNATTNMFVIHHYIEAGDEAKNLARISHGGVRVMGMIYGQFFSKMVLNPDEASRSRGVEYVLTKTDKLGWASVKQTLANQFLLDLLQSNDARFKIENLETAVLGVGSAKKIRDAMTSQGADADLLAFASFDYGDGPSSEQIEARRAQFQDFVFGEAFDSATCSSATRVVMARSFKNTLAVYQAANISNLIQSLGRDISSKMGRKSLGLTEVRSSEAALADGPSAKELLLADQSLFDTSSIKAITDAVIASIKSMNLSSMISEYQAYAGGPTSGQACSQMQQLTSSPSYQQNVSQLANSCSASGARNYFAANGQTCNSMESVSFTGGSCGSGAVAGGSCGSGFSF